MRCLSCIRKKQGCSFRRESFGIAKWPTVIRSDEGNRLRKAEAKRKRAQSQQLPMLATEGVGLIAEEEEELPEVEDLDYDLGIPIHIDATEPVTATPSPISIQPGFPIGIVGATHWAASLLEAPVSTEATIVPLQISYQLPRVAGDAYLQLQWADLLAIEEMVSNTPHSLVALRTRFSEVRLTRFRERNDVQLVISTLKDRQGILMGILKRLTARIEAEHRSQIDEEPSGEAASSEDVADDEYAGEDDEMMDDD
jgi:hypothetical protein